MTTALEDAALVACMSAARFTHERREGLNHPPLFTDMDFDAAWAMWRELRSILPTRPAWIRPTINNSDGREGGP